MNDLPVFKTSNEFSLHIEKMAVELKLSHLDAILKYCADHMIEPSDIASKVNKSLKEKIENDFRELNYLPRQAKLDV
jgi:cell division ATPase FtsA